MGFGARGERKVFSGPNTNTNIIRIIPNTNNSKYEYKKHQKAKLRTEKIAYWVFCALITTETLKSRLWVKFLLFGFQTSTEYEYE